MAYTAGFSVNVGDPTKASDVTTLAANDDFLKAAVDAIMADSATPSSTLKATVVLADGVTATTQSAGNNTTRVATTAFVKTAVDASSTDPGGSNTEIQYNNSGAFGASANLTFTGSLLTLSGDQVITDGNGLISGHTARVQVYNSTGENQILGTTDADANLSITRYSNDNGPPNLVFGKSRNGSLGGQTIVADGDPLGRIIFCGSDGVDMRSAGAWIEAECDGEFEADNVSGRIIFATTPDNAGSQDPTERVRIDSAGRVGVGTTSPDGTLHVHTASCGTETANALGNILVLEDDDNNGMSILTPDNAYGQILWGSPSGDGATGDCNARIAAGYNSGNQRLDISVGQTNSALTVHDTGNVAISGALSKGSGSFRIDHPLPEKTDTHHLVHSFVEGPQADLIYRGTATLNSGTATINLDTAARMTDGTFVELNTNVQAFTSNESGWDAVRGSVSGNVLTIASSDNTSTASVSWLVIGERKDVHMIDTNWTDSEGRVITEPQKPAEKEDDEDGAEE